MKHLTLLATAFTSLLHAMEKPNIVFIFADDLGWGDVQHINPDKAQIPTPNLDKMCQEGMYFTDAHTSSSVCTLSLIHI